MDLDVRFSGETASTGASESRSSDEANRAVHHDIKVLPFLEAVTIRDAANAAIAVKANPKKSAIRSVKEHRQQTNSAQGDGALNEIFRG